MRRPGAGRALAALAVLGAGCGAEGPRGARHALLVSIDTLRADVLGCYGEPLPTSPRIDELAAAGVLFEHATSAASSTLASHTSLMTGCWPHTHGVARNGFRVPAENELLAEVLSAAGFRTAGFVGAMPLDPAFGLDQGFAHYDARYTVRRTGQDYSQMLERRAREVTDAVLAWLDAEPVEDGERLFLFAHYFDCHAPYAPPGAFAGRFREAPAGLDDADAELSRVRRGLREAAAAGRPGGDDPGLAAAASGLEADYRAELAYVDRHLGRLLDGLRERGLLAETLVVLTADHGETLTDHEPPFTHGYTVFDSEVHVPLIVVAPPGVLSGASGRRASEPVSGIDVAPTVLALLGVPAPPAMEGTSLVAALEGLPLGRGPVFAEATKPTGQSFPDDPVWANRSRYQCARVGPWKYARRGPDGREHLFDLEADPGERRDLLPDAAERAEPLRAALESWSAEGAGRPRAGALDSAAHAEALRALGYVDDD